MALASSWFVSPERRHMTVGGARVRIGVRIRVKLVLGLGLQLGMQDSSETLWAY